MTIIAPRSLNSAMTRLTSNALSAIKRSNSWLIYQGCHTDREAAGQQDEAEEPSASEHPRSGRFGMPGEDDRKRFGRSCP